MKVITSLLVLLCPLLAGAQDAQTTDEVVLRGVFDMGSKKLYSLSTPGAAKSGWLKTGDTFLDYTIGEYDVDTKQLTLTQDDEVFVITLAGASAGAAPADDPNARLEEAKKVFEAMQFKETIGKAIDAQMDVIADMQRKQLMKMNSPLANDQEYLDFMDNAMRTMMDDIDWSSIQTGMEQVYAETFTEAELKGITEFYSTPAGQATVEKSAELQQKTMQILMPSIMESSQKMTENLVKFTKEREKQLKSDSSESK